MCFIYLENGSYKGCNVVKVWQAALDVSAPLPLSSAVHYKIIRYLETTQVSEERGKQPCKTENKYHHCLNSAKRSLIPRHEG